MSSGFFLLGRHCVNW